MHMTPTVQGYSDIFSLHLLFCYLLHNWIVGGLCSFILLFYVIHFHCQCWTTYFWMNQMFFFAVDKQKFIKNVGNWMVLGLDMENAVAHLHIQHVVALLISKSEQFVIKHVKVISMNTVKAEFDRELFPGFVE